MPQAPAQQAVLVIWPASPQQQIHPIQGTTLLGRLKEDGLAGRAAAAAAWQASHPQEPPITAFLSVQHISISGEQAFLTVDTSPSGKLLVAVADIKGRGTVRG